MLSRFRRQRDQIVRVSANRGGVACGPPDINPHVAAVGPAQLLQDLYERSDAVLLICIVRAHGHEHADAPYRIRPLRA